MNFVVKTISRILFGVSFVVWLLLAFIGTYDREDLFHSLYSIGGFFGGIGSGPWNFSLTRTYLGIPVIDLGLVGGFRLPYQGSLHSGFLWPLRTLVPSVAIALLYILASLLLATYAFTLCTGSWLRGEWSRREGPICEPVRCLLVSHLLSNARISSLRRLVLRRASIHRFFGCCVRAVPR